MSVTAAIRKMVDAGLSLEAALEIAAELEASAGTSSAPSLTARQERNRRYYEKRRASESVLTPSETPSEKASESVSIKTVKTPHARDRVSDKTSKTVEKSLFEERESRAPKTPREWLLTVLEPQRADDVLAHRSKLRSGLSPRAAELLAVEFSKTPDPNAAADMMISRAWRGFKAEWMEGERQNGTGNRSNGAGRPADGGPNSRGARLMRAFGVGPEADGETGDGPTIDGRATVRPGG